ncbi:MAG: hypothetical protein IT236_16415 [Bacteroidia bacterium]|nr:hypothetical protein [Bacteroidia bacterium]
MIKNYFLVGLIFSLTYFAKAQISSVTVYKNDNKSVLLRYHTKNGRFTGKYTSYYWDGKKKAQGHFDNNSRKGSWTVWDSTGRKRMIRRYRNNYEFERIFPEIPKDNPTIQLLYKPDKFVLHRNDSGYYNYHHVQERMVLWEKRLWRHLDEKDNSILFENNRLWNVIFNAVKSEGTKILPYTDEEFNTKYEGKTDTTTFTVVGWKIKEDVFFNSELQGSESRIIGICQVVKNKKDGTLTDLYWLYYPAIRTALAKEKVQAKDLPSEITNLDDVFFFRYFYGRIAKESNVYDRAIKKYALSDEEQKLESDNIEMSMIDEEHNRWLELTK